MRYPQDQNHAPKCCELCSRNKTPTQTALGGSIDTERMHLSIEDVYFIRFFGASIKHLKQINSAKPSSAATALFFDQLPMIHRKLTCK